MHRRTLHTLFLFFLALVFTVGLAFATVELPYRVDDLLMETVRTPNLSTHADEVTGLKTELFIAHYHLRAIGYLCFALLVSFIVVGFATPRRRLAAVGALGFMLPVFAQFAGVMFFLAGLGVLNVLWLPVLDVSFGLSGLGQVIRAPYDGLMWLFGLLGADGYWPIVLSFIGGRLLIFLMGTFAWLSARARKQEVADFWVYRLSRHPQYLGWILWSYGVYLLILRALYPKRVWGIDASLPWLLSTMVIIGVAMLEELQMRRRHGEAYEAYRRSAPFLFPLPAIVERLLALPQRLLFRRARPERAGEVAAVLSLHAAVLIGASWLFYGQGLERVVMLVSPSVTRETAVEAAADRLLESSPRWAYARSRELTAFGEPAVDHLLPMLRHDTARVRSVAARALGDLRAERALPVLVAALHDADENVRGSAVEALAAIGSNDAVAPLLEVARDEEASWVRIGAIRAVDAMGAEESHATAMELLGDPESRVRHAGVEILGVLGSERSLDAAVRALSDESAWVRQGAVIALLRIGSAEARGALEAATHDDDWEVRLYAEEALKRIPAGGSGAEG
jgi:protein-S-isoprenylcysteine O-methyltransferase Ste14